MKYMLLEILFGWLTRPILLWDFVDILVILAELFTIITVIKSIEKLGRRKKDEQN